jgi:hypothetical protein
LGRKKNPPKERKRKGNKYVDVLPQAEPSNVAQARYYYSFPCLFYCEKGRETKIFSNVAQARFYFQ